MWLCIITMNIMYDLFLSKLVIPKFGESAFLQWCGKLHLPIQSINKSTCYSTYIWYESQCLSYIFRVWPQAKIITLWLTQRNISNTPIGTINNVYILLCKPIELTLTMHAPSCMSCTLNKIYMWEDSTQETLWISCLTIQMRLAKLRTLS